MEAISKNTMKAAARFLPIRTVDIFRGTRKVNLRGAAIESEAVPEQRVSQ